MGPLDALLAVQEHDTALDRLRHRRATFPERAELDAREAALAEAAPVVAAVRERRDEVDAQERRLADEAASLEEKAAGVEATMYSGSVSSPRELQAMQADVEQLRRHRRGLEDRELELMQQREDLDAELAGHEARVRELGVEVEQLRVRLHESEAVVDGELVAVTAARGDVAAEVPPDLLATYERCREKARGVGAARLVGRTCEGCHLTIPATEVDRIRKQGSDAVSHCDNCGCILVPA